MKKVLLPVLLSGLWITISEFLRNELLFKSFWTAHYKNLGLTFQTLPLNGIIWMVWSFILAFLIYWLLQKYTFTQMLIFSWLAAFVLMWLTLFNLQVLPLQLLIVAIPFSLVEILVAGFIQRRF